MHPTSPSGIVTFLFTDLEGSTRLWETHPKAMQSALARHDRILKEAINEHGGELVKSTGDGIHAVFTSPTSSASAALAAQEVLLAETWQDTSPLRVRMGLHSGEAQYRDGDYYGTSVNRAARHRRVVLTG